jgi:hypothetical protein
MKAVYSGGTSPLLSPLRCGEGKEAVYGSEKYANLFLFIQGF